MPKICSRGYSLAQVCAEDGQVRVCTWSSLTNAGKLSEMSMKEIMHSDKVKLFHDALLKGDYSFCDEHSCAYLKDGKIDERILVDYEGELDYPKTLFLAYDHTCNYQCPSCRKGDNICFGKTNTRDFTLLEHEIGKFINKVEVLNGNGLGELFASQSIMKLLQNWKPVCENPIVSIETNGSLFTPDNWEKIKCLSKYDLRVNITIMSFDEMTYQTLSGCKLSVNNIINNLKFVKTLRDRGDINYLELATVVQERNFRMLPEFTWRCIEEFGADCVRLRPYESWGVDDRNIEWFYDVVNSEHPYHHEYVQIMKDPIFKNPKVNLWCVNDERKIVHPSKKYQKDYDTIFRIVTDEKFASKVQKFLLSNNISKLYLYGAGGIGKTIANVLLLHNVEICSFIDEISLESSYNGIRILPLNKTEFEEDSFVLINLATHIESIDYKLEKYNVNNYIYINELLERIVKE